MLARSHCLLASLLRHPSTSTSAACRPGARLAAADMPSGRAPSPHSLTHSSQRSPPGRDRSLHHHHQREQMSMPSSSSHPSLGTFFTSSIRWRSFTAPSPLRKRCVATNYIQKENRGHPPIPEIGKPLLSRSALRAKARPCHVGAAKAKIRSKTSKGYDDDDDDEDDKERTKNRGKRGKGCWRKIKGRVKKPEM